MTRSATVPPANGSAAISPPGMLKIGATLLLTSPFTPMLFMGEEWAASTPWPFFTSHPEPELAEATAAGRLAEFAEHGWDEADVVNPQDPAAYAGAKLRWAERGEPAHAEMLRLYRDLLRLRRDHPDLADPHLDAIRVDYDEQSEVITVHRGAFDVLANFSDRTQRPPATGHTVFATDPGVRMDQDAITLPPQSAAIVAHPDRQ